MSFSLSIKTRLTLWYLLIIAVILIFFSLFTYYMLSRSLLEIAQGSSRLTIIQSENWLSDPGTLDSSLQLSPVMTYLISPEWLYNLKSAPSSVLSIHTPFGQINIDQKKYITADMQGEQQVQLFLRPSPGTPSSYEILVVTQPISEVENTLAAFSRVLLFVIPITSVLAAGFGFLLIWRWLKPVNEIAKIARDIEENDLSRRIAVRSNDELGRLATTLNQTFERLEQAFLRERQFTSDASHELRTPLSIMQSEATLTLKKDRSQEEYKEALILISQEIAHMSSIINKLLFLSRVDGGKEKLDPAAVNLSELLIDLASNIEALCEEKTLLFDSQISGDIRVEGDKVKLRELFLNLMDNAIKFTPAGGKISLSLVKTEGQAAVSVSDTGIGISEEHLPRIFDRFYRVNKTSSAGDEGSGLGLAICKHIVALHKGQIQVKSTFGKGSTFKITLPLAKG
jgi:heavy metal sensor kinase